MNRVFINGEFVERSHAKVDIEDRGYQFGDGIYEVIRVYNGVPFTMNEHMERLYKSGEKMKLVVPYEIEELTALILELIKTNKVEDGSVYLQVTRGISLRQHNFPAPDVKCSIVAYTKEVSRPIKQMEEGVTAKLTEDIRWLRCDIKSLNLLGNLLAKEEAISEGHFEAILHRGETITEGSSSNVFIVKNKEIFTHPATNLILNGITRRVIQELCRTNEIIFNEASFEIKDLLNADECFIASTTAEIMPIIKVGNKQVGDGNPGKVTTALQDLFKKRIEKEVQSLL